MHYGIQLKPSLVPELLRLSRGTSQQMCYRLSATCTYTLLPSQDGLHDPHWWCCPAGWQLVHNTQNGRHVSRESTPKQAKLQLPPPCHFRTNKLLQTHTPLTAERSCALHAAPCVLGSLPHTSIVRVGPSTSISPMPSSSSSSLSTSPSTWQHTHTHTQQLYSGSSSSSAGSFSGRAAPKRPQTFA